MRKLITILLLLITFNSFGQLNGWFFVQDDYSYTESLKDNLLVVWEFDDALTAPVAHNELNNIGRDLIYDDVDKDFLGVIGTCVRINGNGSKAVERYSSTTLSPTSYHSISIWFYSTNPATTFYNEDIIISKKEGLSGSPIYALYLTSNISSLPDPYPGENQLIFLYKDSKGDLHYLVYAAPNSEDIWTGQWHHAVMTRTNKVAKLYLDGELKVTKDEGSGFYNQSSSANVVLGAYKTLFGYSGHFNGYIDQGVMWSKALTQDEVTELYNNGYGKAYIDW